MYKNQEIIADDSIAKQQAQNAGVAALVLGICGIMFPGIGLILGIIGVIYAKKSRQLSGGVMNGMAMGGMICSIISIVLGSIPVLVIVGYILLLLISLLLCKFYLVP